MDRSAFFKYRIHKKESLLRLSRAFTQKDTDSNLEEVMILKAGIICVKK